MHSNSHIKQVLGIVLVAISLFAISAPSSFADTSNSNVGVWWPTDNAHVTGVQPFKVMADNMSVDQYDMYWQVDNGQLNLLPSSNDGYPHKEAQVDLTNWNWKGTGPYVVNFVAKSNGNTFAQRSINLYNDAATPVAVATPTQVDQPAIVPVIATSTPAPAVIAPVAEATSSLPQPNLIVISTAPSTLPLPIITAPTSTQISTMSLSKSVVISTPTIVVSTASSSVASTTNTTVPVATATPSLIITSVAPAASLNVWWPASGAHLDGNQPFKALIPNMNIDSYTMYWSVDSGNLVPMSTAYTTEGSHKETWVDVSNWNWNSSGQYILTFTAKDDSGTVIATQKVPIQVGVVPASVTALQTPILPTVANVLTGNLAGINFYVNPQSTAAAQAKTWRFYRPNDAQAMDVLASQATAVWIGNWNGDVYKAVRKVTDAAQKSNTVPVFVAYNIPDRDCGGYSAGGMNSPEGYRSWIGSFAAAIGSTKAVVILEPDALANSSCLSASDLQTRLSLISGAVDTFKNTSSALVYIDAGHSGWVDPSIIAEKLKQANIARADGFSLNVSNFQASSDTITYGTLISQATGNKHFVIDTSRNGLGADLSNAWCNPSGKAIGVKPTTATGNSLVDADLWIKTPGESDGNCNGGPNAGEWWPEYALNLVNNSK
jgi:endoglucanase